MKVQEGDRIYYTGDMANDSAWCAVSEVHTDSLGQPVYVALRPEDTEDRWTIHVAQIGDKYHGHCDPRFVTERAHNAYHGERLQLIRDRMTS